MEISKLSWYYHHACDRIHEIVDDLYEALHKETGIPKEEMAQVEEALEGVRAAIYQELDLIKSAVGEHEEQ
jgi:HEAT repeat protein